MADINGYLKDKAGTALGTSSNPLVVTFSTTQPQTFVFSEPTVKEVEKIVYRDVIVKELIYVKIREPRGILEKIWQKAGYYMGWI